MPSYVLFVGKANYDCKNYLGIPSGSYVHNTVPAYGNAGNRSMGGSFGRFAFNPTDVCWAHTCFIYGRVPELLYTSSIVRFATIQRVNKRYIFFAGGTDNLEYGLFHSVNTNVINNCIMPAPIGGLAFDFYKSTT